MAASKPKAAEQEKPKPAAKARKVCAAANCGEPVAAYGLCEQHARSTTGQ